MALMVIASLPSRFRPPPDPPPPYKSPLLDVLSPFAPPVPPDPPDPPDAVYLLVPLRILITYAKPSLQDFTQTLVLILAYPSMVAKFSGGGAPLVSSGDTSFAFRRLSPVVCRSRCRGVDGSSFKSYIGLSFPPPRTVLQVHLYLSVATYLYSVEWVGMQVVWMTLDIRTLVLIDDVLMDRVTFSSTLVPLGGIYVVSVRSLTVVYSFPVVSGLAFGAVMLVFSSLWQLEKKLIGIFHLLNIVLTDTEFSMVSCLELSLFPVFPLVWSELEAQALLVLQGSSSQLMPLPALGAVIVIFWITLDAITQEAYRIVMRFLWFLVVSGINFIPCFSYCCWSFVTLLYPPLMEFKLF